MKALKPSEVEQFIVDSLKCRMIPYIYGPPGIGKSDIVAKIAKDFNLKLLDIRLSQMLQEDLTGIPEINPNTNKASYRPFDTFPLEGDNIPEGYVGWIIFLDELSSASEEVMAAIYNLLLGHRIGGFKIHPKALIVAAGNRSTDSAIARPLPDTLITRMLPCEMKVSGKDWVAWAEENSDKSNSSVINFISKYDDMLLGTVDHITREEVETYPTPRGWGQVCKIMNMHERESQSLNDKNRSMIQERILNMISAAVGSVPAQAFKEFYNESLQIPQPFEVATSPQSTLIPSSTACKNELTCNLSDYFIQSNEQVRDNLLQFMNRMDPEYRVIFTRQITTTLGNTESDKKLIEAITKRLDIKNYNKGNTRYQIGIADAGDRKFDLIEEVRIITGWDSKGGKDFVEGNHQYPKLDLSFDTRTEAERISAILTSIGATVIITEYEMLF